MNKQELLKELASVEKEARKIDPLISDQLQSIGNKLASVPDDDFQDDLPIEKQAKLLSNGDRVVCVNAVSPLFKGRIYIVADNSMPGFVSVKEEDGCDVGIFEVNRFLKDWKAY